MDEQCCHVNTLPSFAAFQRYPFFIFQPIFTCLISLLCACLLLLVALLNPSIILANKTHLGDPKWFHTLWLQWKNILKVARRQRRWGDLLYCPKHASSIRMNCSLNLWFKKYQLTFTETHVHHGVFSYIWQRNNIKASMLNRLSSSRRFMFVSFSVTVFWMMVESFFA